MHRLEREDFVQAPYVALWGLLGFQAGFINAFGFLACGRYVSHVTGFGTQIGIALANSNLLFAIELLGIPIWFVAGSFLSSLITSVKIERGLKPWFDTVALIISVLILLLIVLGTHGIFGHFGDQLIENIDFLLLFLLSLVCG